MDSLIYNRARPVFRYHQKMKCILGKKVGMTNLFTAAGATLPVTLIEAGPCQVIEVRTKEKDGYTAIQIGFGVIKKGKAPRAAGLSHFRYLREFRLKDVPADFEKGSLITVENFAPGDLVKVTGTMKGRGFQGGVKRHGFSGGRATHGDRHVLRKIGSIGASYPEKVWKGKRMPGHYGATQVSVKNMKVAAVDPKENLIAVHGAVPGARGSLVQLTA